MKLVLLTATFLSISVWNSGATYLSCPPSSGNVGICSEMCSTDTECSQGEKCCSNGCGHSCVKALVVPYHIPPLKCPSSPSVSQCSTTCLANANCSSGELCCPTSCGTTCIPGESPSPLCPAVRNQLTNTTVIGAYVPTCEVDGSFTPVQCHGSTGYCWCVDPVSGVPKSDMVRFQKPQCSPRTFLSCPVPQGDVVGTCDEQCDATTACQSGQKCCSNGCGHICTSNLLTIPYIAPEQGAQAPFCEGVRQQATSKGLLGAYVPQCNTTGNFLPLQCHESSCWCVNTESGQPTSDMVSGSAVGTLPCSGCDYNGTHYDHGASVTAATDGHSSCTCSRGQVVCAVTMATFLSCPVPQSDVVGTCDEQCDATTACQSGQKCCSNGCGHACTSNLLTIPYVAPEQGAQAPFCKGVRQQATSKGLLGAYVPQCNTTGNFLPLQCHESSCWCVNTENGQPTSDMVSGSAVSTLPCSGCQYNGRTYAHKEKFNFDQCGGFCMCEQQHVICAAGLCYHPGSVTGSNVPSSSPALSVEEQLPQESEQWYTFILVCVVTVTALSLVTVILFAVVVGLVRRQNHFSHLKVATTEEFVTLTDNFADDIDLKPTKQT